ncbi:MAG: hypothetical protein HKN09_03945 [Saprospiraceae bacterium]|nr:hypothetical protein [Saprospiraceae bacterium]
MIAIDYMDTDDAQNYVEIEKNIYKPLHAKSVDKEQKLGWILYEIIYPYGEDTKYNYATVNLYQDSKQAFDISWTDFMESFNEIHPDKDIEEIQRQTQKLRTLVSGEMFALVDEAVPGPSTKPAEYISVNHMVVHPGKDQEYIGMETEIWKPLHQQRIKEGNAQDWFLFRRLFPYGAEFGYQYVTVDAHGSLEQMTTPNSNETWSEVHPDMEFESVLEKVEDIRTLRRQETWRMIDYTFGSQNEN